MSKILLSAALAAAVLGGAVSADAASRRDQRQVYAPAPYSYEFFTFNGPSGYARRPVGGHSYYWQHRSWPFVDAAGYNYPGYYNNQSFWDRVQTQANYPLRY